MKSVSLELDTEELAQLYERVSADRQYKAGQRLVRDLQVSAGERVLDVGCGTGMLAEYIVTMVGPSGAVTGIDPLPLRIEIARRRTGSNLNFRVGNAYDLSEFARDTFDAVCMNAVFHWLPEKLEPLRQTIRVLKPGGRLGISTGAKGSPNPLHGMKERVLARAPYNQYPAAAETVVHRVSVAELAGLLTQTGFAVKTIETRPIAPRELSAEEAIGFSEASSFGNLLGHLPAELRAAAREDLKRELEEPGAIAALARERSRIVAIAVKR